MPKLIAVMTLAAVIVIAVSCGVSKSTEAERTLAYGFAQSQMTMASAEASATRTAAIVPILAMMAIVIFGMIFLATPIAIVLILRYAPSPQMQSNPQSPVRVIEQRTILLLPSGDMSRHELYQLVSGTSTNSGQQTEIRRIG